MPRRSHPSEWRPHRRRRRAAAPGTNVTKSGVPLDSVARDLANDRTGDGRPAVGGRLGGVGVLDDGRTPERRFGERPIAETQESRPILRGR